MLFITINLLVIGREAGSVVKSFHKTVENINLASVDVLGNREVRKYSKWSFSVVKQAKGRIVDRQLHRPLIEYLIELSKIMIEEQNIDYIIPLTPLDREPTIIKQLNVDTPFKTNIKPINKVNSTYSLIKEIDRRYPDLSLLDTIIASNQDKLSNNSAKINYPGIIVTKENNTLINSNNDLLKTVDDNKNTYFISLTSVYSCQMYIDEEKTNIISYSKIASPLGKKLNIDDFTKNSYYNITKDELVLKSLDREITYMCNLLNLKGFVTLFFTLKKQTIIPIYLSLLPDPNFDIWIDLNRVKIITENNKISITVNNNQKEHLLNYQRIPVYSKRSLVVPDISDKEATHRNVIGALSSPNYPIYCKYGYK